MSQIKSSKTQNNNKQDDTLNALGFDQTLLYSNTYKSLILLKKIKEHLKEIVAQRKQDHYRFNKLKKNTSLITQQIKQTKLCISEKNKESQQSINNDLTKIKTNIEKTNKQFADTTAKLGKEIASLKELVKRVDNKIISIEKEANTDKKELESTGNENTLLLKKVNQFEEKLNQFKDTSMTPEESVEYFSTQLTQLDQVVTQSKHEHQDNDTQIKLLQTNVTNVRQLLQQDNNIFINEVKKQKKEGDHSKRALPFTQQSVQQIAEKLSKQAFKDQSKQYNQQVQSLHDKHFDLQDNHTQPSIPLKGHVKDLKENIQTLQEGYKKQQKIIDEDTENLRVLNETINQFNEQLEQSYQELKEYIQKIHESDKHENSQQFQELNKNFERLSQQIIEQQQQLEGYDTQLVKLKPLITKPNETKKSLVLLSDKIDTLNFSQNELSEQEEVLQENLSTLTAQVNTEYSTQQKDLQSIVSEQESQFSYFEQLNNKLTIRSQLFLAALVTSMAISAAIFYYRDMIHLPITSDNTTPINSNTIDSNNVIGQTNTHIDDLVKQNNTIEQTLEQKFSDIEKSIIQVKKQITEQATQKQQESEQQSEHASEQLRSENLSQDKWQEEFKTLEENWQQQHTSLQTNISQTQAEQKDLKESISKFSNSMNAMIAQIDQLKQMPVQKSTQVQYKTQHSAPSQQQKNYTSIDITSIDIKSIKYPYFTIQILGAKDEESIARFIEKNALPSNGQIIKTNYNNKIWYILSYGQFMNYSDAKNELHILPEELQKNNPWVRKIP